MPPRRAASPSTSGQRRGQRDPSMPPGLGFTPRKSIPSPGCKAPATFVPTDGKLMCIVYIVIYHVIVIVSLAIWHLRTHNVINPIQLLLAIFLTTNAWICVCEIALLSYPTLIQRQFAAFCVKFGDHVLPSPIFLFERVRLRDVLSVRYWAIMWSSYSTLDPAYIDTHSFGYCVDVGNGVTTLIPTLLFACGMTAQSALFSSRTLGIVGAISFYQEFYGTCVYFFQYCFNKRYVGTPKAQVYGVVVVANGIWIAFPLLGMWASLHLIFNGNFTVFL